MVTSDQLETTFPKMLGLSAYRFCRFCAYNYIVQNFERKKKRNELYILKGTRIPLYLTHEKTLTCTFQEYQESFINPTTDDTKKEMKKIFFFAF